MRLSGLSLVLALGLASLAALPAAAYERELNSRDLREAYFLGKDDTFRAEKFFKDYVKELPVPESGVHVARVAIATPFKTMVDRSASNPGGYSPMKAEDQYKQDPPPVTIEVTLLLTASYPAHTPYTIPNFDPVLFRDPDFWREFDVHLLQRGEVKQLSRTGRPLYNCDAFGGCTLTGAVLTVTYDPGSVASQDTRVQITGPDGQQVEVEFDLARLR